MKKTFLPTLIIALCAAMPSTVAQGITEVRAEKKAETKSESPVPKKKTGGTLDSYLADQLAREKAKHHTYFENLAKNATETGQRDLKRLRLDKNTPVYTPNDNTYQPMAARVPGYTPSSGQSGLPARSPVYVSQELEYAKMREAMAQEKAEQLRKVAAEKEANLQQSMENMKSQMKTSNVPGAAVARPDGSNLFVRYYGPSPTSKPYEVHPAAARIVPHQ